MHVFRLSPAWILALFAIPALAATPTINQVYDAMNSGRLTEAQQMINQVLQEKPQSQMAHYVAAQVDAKLGNYAAAEEELRKTEQLGPGLKSVVSRFRQQLAQMSSSGAASGVPRGSQPRGGGLSGGTPSAGDVAAAGSGVAFLGIMALTFLAIYLLPFIIVIRSRRASGGAKFGWLVVVFFFSYLGLAVFLIATQKPVAPVAP